MWLDFLTGEGYYAWLLFFIYTVFVGYMENIFEVFLVWFKNGLNFTIFLNLFLLFYLFNFLSLSCN